MTENWGIAEFFGILFIFPFYLYLAGILFDFFGRIRQLFGGSDNRKFRISRAKWNR